MTLISDSSRTATDRGDAGEPSSTGAAERFAGRAEPSPASILPLFCFSVALASCLVSTATTTSQITIAVVFACAAISSIAGFAFSALAGAILFQINPDTVHTVQILLVSSIAIQAYAVWDLRRTIRVERLLPLVAGGASMVVPGLYVLLNTPSTFYIPALGCFMIGYGAYALLGPVPTFRTRSLPARVLVGALGGLTSAIAAFPGAFVVIWCRAQGWSKERQRAITQPYILAMQVITLGLLMVLRPGDAMRIELLQYVAPAMLGAYFGLGLYRLLSTRRFNQLVSVFLLLAGVVMLLKAS